MRHHGAGVHDYKLGPHQPWSLTDGFIVEVDLADFAGNAVRTRTVPGGRWERPIGARLDIQNDATVANRTPLLTILDQNGVVVLATGSTVATTANNARSYFWSDRVTAEINVGGGNIIDPWPTWPLPSGWTYQFKITNGVAGDTVTKCKVIAVHWVDAEPPLVAEYERKRMRELYKIWREVENELGPIMGAFPTPVGY